jgi:hypothetical protein
VNNNYKKNLTVTNSRLLLFILFIFPYSEVPGIVLAKIQETLTKSDALLSQVGDVEDRGRHLLAELSASSTEKLDVGDLVEMDRGLQAIVWVETIKSVGKQLDDIW